MQLALTEVRRAALAVLRRRPDERGPAFSYRRDSDLVSSPQAAVVRRTSPTPACDAERRFVAAEGAGAETAAPAGREPRAAARTYQS